MKNALRWVLILSVLAVAGLSDGPFVRAQVAQESCTSFAPLVSDTGDPLSYTVPLHYGAFADIELAASGQETVQLQVEALQDSAIKDRRTWVLIPGRVVLLTEVLGVNNLFDVGSPLVVHISAPTPVSAILVRRN
jgi:hypothetical protein